MRDLIFNKIESVLHSLGYPKENIIIEVPKNPDHGDFSSNIAMTLVKLVKQSSFDIAQQIIQKLLDDNNDGFFSDISIAGPGFINFKINSEFINSQLLFILEKSNDFGKSDIGKGQRVLVEFVSANPTGPLTVGHGRGAILGDTAGNILEWNGFDVQREYYFNDAGRQMRILANSVYARYLEILGESSDFPEEGYHGTYIKDIAQVVFDEHKDSLINKPESSVFKDTAESIIFNDIKNSLSNLGVVFDTFFNEHRLYDSGEIEEVLSVFRKKDMLYEKDGATWFKGTTVGRNADKVLIKSTGEPTYRLPDIAYHQNKFRRNYDLIIDVFGADHSDTFPDVVAGIKELGFSDEKMKILIHQFVTIVEDGVQVKMSTRKANFITLDELSKDVGSDVVRYFFLMRGMNTHLNFDINLAKNQSDENPVFYLQYAHARVCNIIKRAEANGHQLDTSADLSLLKEDIENQLIRKLLEFPEIVKYSADTLEPQPIANYLNDISGLFHKFYAHHRVISDDIDLTSTRLILVQSVKIVLANGLKVLGISAPERM